MLLKNLIKNLPPKLKKLKIKGLASNSKEVRKGFIFFALKGIKFNGENYIDKAIKNGAILIVCSKNCKFRSTKVKIFKTKQVKSYLSEITSKFYRLKPKNIIAVTGTNGKTSVADFFYQILKINNIPVATIGTLGIRSNRTFVKTNLTTPDIITIHKNLEKLKKNKVDHVIIEASSHGLDQNRLDNLNLKAGIFTNFSQDHLDYHKTMKAYLNSKLRLFSKLLPKNSKIISDKSIKEYSNLKIISKRRKLKLLDISNQINKIRNISSSSLTESFQVKNLSMAILAARICKLEETEINRAIKKIKNVNGRLELVKKYPNNIRVFIDYAHTPDALKTVIHSIRNIYNNDISIVFGCGGERDYKKRPLMAKVAKSLCKKIYVTDDNPRKENPKKIRRELTLHLKGSDYFNIGNRSKAIRIALLNAEPNENILIAGKGHENYQDYGNRIISISDRQIINKIKFSKKKVIKKKYNYLFNSNILNTIIKSKKFNKFSGLAIDSRQVKKNNLFLAIRGKKNDGNQFISEALKKGASFAVSSKHKVKNKVFKIDNSINFLNKFAQLKREHCKAKILAITGSCGKTSLKDMLNKLLLKYDKTYASPKSFNNHYGVPISLSNLDVDHKFGVFEVGMSKAGEIDKLSKLIKPNLAIITNIAEAHIENFKNIKGIAKAKSEILDNIHKNGTVILNRDDKFFNYISKKALKKNLKVVSFGWSNKSNVSLIKINRYKKEKQIFIRVNDKILKLKVKNVNVYNILASLAVLNELNLDHQKCVNELKNFNPPEGRGEIHKIRRYKKFFWLLDESYNANPFSVKNAIRRFSEFKKNKCKKYLLLGDMLELGNRSKNYHEDLSGLINSSDIDKVFIKGEKTLFTYKKLKKNKRGNIFQCNDDADLILKNIITNNDYLMIKGSNATNLNKISKKMIKGI